ncbi:hypothetical protein QR680_016044 [Steinernema hermaphroditum]|uniref:C-type lectin domain-containing protein n=1 Tax=Steinernema hermaphroditum TaxID=289476 RepID=A0AA39HAS6_9BILA|nr:hypothetical protein QR680_016044 [Steinernema hermaphroditum]
MKRFLLLSSLLALALSCPLGWSYLPKTDSCYKHFPIYKNFTDAQAACKNEGAELPSVTSIEENNFVQAISWQGRDGRWRDQPWIGGYTNSATANYPMYQWKWTDGQPWSYTNWCPENPDQPWEKCVQLLVDNCPICKHQFRLGCWNNLACDSMANYVCRKNHIPSAQPIQMSAYAMEMVDFKIIGPTEAFGYDGTLQGCLSSVVDNFEKPTFFEFNDKLQFCRAYTSAFAATPSSEQETSRFFFMGTGATSAKDALTNLCYQDPNCLQSLK